MAKERVAIFVDGENVTRAFRLDVKVLKEILTGDRDLTVAVWRDSYKDQAEYEKKSMFYRAVGYNFEVRPVPLKTNGNGLAKSRADAYLMVDIFERLLQEELGEQPRTDVWVLVSGDSDFQPVLELLKARGRKVEVAFTDGLSCELQQLADRLINLNEQRTRIERKPKSQTPAPPAGLQAHKASAQAPKITAQTPSATTQPQTPPQTQLQPQAPISIQIRLQVLPAPNTHQSLWLRLFRPSHRNQEPEKQIVVE